MLIRTGDTVEVIAGNDSGRKSRVIKVDRETGKAIVEGVNGVKKHIRRSQKYPQGGVLKKEMPIQLSNVHVRLPVVQCVDPPWSSLPRRRQQGRFCKKCGASAGEIAPAKKAHASSATRKTKKPAKATQPRNK